MKPLETKAESRPVEPEQESYPVYCIEEVFKAFIEYAKGQGRSWQTIERHEAAFSLLGRYLAERNGQAGGLGGKAVGLASGVGVAVLTPVVMAGFQAWLYQARSRYGRPYKIKSQIITLNSIQVFGHFLAASGRLLHDPSESIQMPKEPKSLPGVFLSALEMKKLLRQPDTGTVLGFRDQTICVLSATVHSGIFPWQRVRNGGVT